MWSICAGLTPAANSSLATFEPSGLPAVAPMAISGKRRSPSGRE